MNKYAVISCSALFGSLFSFVAMAMEEQQQEADQQKVEVEKLEGDQQKVEMPKHGSDEQLAERLGRLNITDLSVSVKDRCSKGNDDAYEESTEKMKSDPTKPRIFFLTKNNQCYWPALVNRGYSSKGFTEKDLEFVVDEFSEHSKLTSEQGAYLFDLMIIQQLSEKHSGKYKNDVIQLVMSPKLVIADGYYSRVRKQNLSVMSHMVEKANKTNRYLDAFNKVLKLLPIVHVDKDIVVTREEYNYGKSQYEPKSYVILDWLKRTAEGQPARYLDQKYKRRDQYVTAAKHVADHYLADEHNDIEKDLFTMITLLHQQNDITEEIFLTAAGRYKKSK